VVEDLAKTEPSFTEKNPLVAGTFKPVLLVGSDHVDRWQNDELFWRARDGEWVGAPGFRSRRADGRYGGPENPSLR